MDNLLDKLGIYDFWGTFVPGFIGTFILYFLRTYLVNENISIYNFKHDIIMYIIFSYFLGIMLHEIGHHIQNKIVYRKFIFIFQKKSKLTGEPFDIFLNNNCNILSLSEQKLCLDYFQQWQKENKIISLSDMELSHLFFNYCDYYIYQKGLGSKSEKMQSLYGMSRSLFVFFGLLSILIFPYSLYYQSTKRIDHLIISSILIMIVFYFRMKRFNEIRLKSVIRTYIVVKSSENRNTISAK